MKKLLFIFIALFLTLGAFAQASITDFKNAGYSTLLSDTVTDAGVGVIKSVEVKGPNQFATIQVTATKISGTVAGTISLLGSLDGTNFKAITLVDASTALATYTATNVASQTFHWRLPVNSFRYYEISWTGTGTMAASFTGKLLTR